MFIICTVYFKSTACNKYYAFFFKIVLIAKNCNNFIHLLFDIVEL